MSASERGWQQSCIHFHRPYKLSTFFKLSQYVTRLVIDLHPIVPYLNGITYFFCLPFFALFFLFFHFANFALQFYATWCKRCDVRIATVSNFAVFLNLIITILYFHLKKKTTWQKNSAHKYIDTGPVNSAYVKKMHNKVD